LWVFRLAEAIAAGRFQTAIAVIEDRKSKSENRQPEKKKPGRNAPVVKP
jgi:hypothetical protein